MKAHIQRSANNIPQWMRDVAIAEGRKQALAQSDDIVRRTLNEAWMAMSEAGLSKRTIERVRKIYFDSIVPYMDRFEGTEGHPEWHDATCDDARRAYLESRDLPYEVPGTDGKV